MTEQATTDAAAGPPEPEVTGTAQQHGNAAAATLIGETLIAEELLVEEVSIDGMCGVY